MRRARIGLPLGLLLLVSASPRGAALQVELPEDPLVQGDLRPVRVTAPEPLVKIDVRFRGLSLPARPEGGIYTVLLAVDLETPPGPHPVTVDARGVSGVRYRLQKRVTVVDGRFPTQRLKLPKAMVDLDAATLDRVRKEQAVLAAIWDKWKDGPYWWNEFVPPLEETGQISSEFGLRRIINGQRRSPHGGVDFGASAGTPVRASNRGVVVYTGEMFFSGNSIVLHHGGGLFTMYFHLQRFRVEQGQEVAKGEVVGWVGATGRVTGPHLHWGARLQHVRFNPHQLLELSLP